MVLHNFVHMIGDRIVLGVLPKRHLYSAAMIEEADGGSETRLHQTSVGVREYGSLGKGDRDGLD